MMSHFEDGGHDVMSCRKFCHLVSEHKASAGAYAAAFLQFLIYSTFLVVSEPFSERDVAVLICC